MNYYVGWPLSRQCDSKWITM